MAELPLCAFGLLLQDECHKTVHTRSVGLHNLSELSDANFELLMLRTKPVDQLQRENCNICFHHEQVLLEKFDKLQRSCCDPFNKHQCKVTKSLRTVSIDKAKELTLTTGRHIKPGEKLCPSCRKYDTSQEPEQSYGHSASDTDIEDVDLHLSQLNDSITSIGCTPVKLHAMPVRSKISYAKRKIATATTEIQKKVSKAIQVPLNLVVNEGDATECDGCNDLTKLVTELKIKCSTASRQEKIKMVTLAPPSWSQQKVSHEFGVTRHVVKQARKLKKSCGILAYPQKKHGKVLPDDVIESVRKFFEDDEISRMCPGQKEFLSIRIDGERVHKQKRLLLLNLKEMHVEFKKRTAMKVGLSKFCSLRPPWCITVDSSGAHAICVCETHQNLKLAVAALPVRTDYKDLLLKVVCSTENRECMLHRCSICPGIDELKSFLEQLFDEADMDLDDIINYKRWTHDGQSKLQSVCETVADFITSLCTSADKTTDHHFTAKAQSSYLRHLKECLPVGTAVVLLDFAENYSFICQDAVQGFHWETSQATLHPFVVYYRELPSNDLCCLSLCIISDDREHVAGTVHAFIEIVLTFLRSKMPDLQKIVYFSDGAAAQYKNCKNLKNLCMHKTDFGIEAEWNFFATSHGKSPCDGIGGTVKRLVARASLQATLQHQILTPHQMYDWATKNIPGIHFFFAAKDDVEVHRSCLVERFASIQTVPGTRSHHRFVAVSENKLKIFRLSCDDLGTIVNVSPEPDLAVEPAPSITDLHPGQFVAVVYDTDWFIGCITEHSDEHQDILVKFMNRTPTNRLTWPHREDICWIPFTNVLCNLPLPMLSGSSARQYIYDDEHFDNCKKLFDSRTVCK